MAGAAAAGGAAVARSGVAAEIPDAATIAAIFTAGSDQAMAYAELLATSGVERGLIGPGEVGRIWSRHLLNCAVAAPLIDQAACVIDVGSGAGLPGVPLALVRPDLKLILLEPLLRRVTFLAEVIDRLGLSDRVQVVRARAEESSLRAEVVVARAVAPLDKLVRSTRSLFGGGQLLAWKGDRACHEVAGAAAALARWGLEAEVLALTGATVVRVRSVSAAAARRSV